MTNNKVLIVGLGAIGLGYDLAIQSDKPTYLSHSKAFSCHPSFELIAAVDPNESLVSTFQDLFQLPAYTNLAEALRDNSPDVLVVASPTSTHKQVIDECLNGRSHTIHTILCEKPLSNSLADALSINQLCASLGVHLFVNYPRRADPSTSVILDLLSHQPSGIFKVNAWYANGLKHCGSHILDLLQCFFGRPKSVVSIDGTARYYNIHHEVDLSIRYQSADVLLRYAYEEHFSYTAFEMLLPTGVISYQDEGRSICYRESVPDQLYPGYMTLSSRPRIITSDLERSQYNVVSELSKSIAGLPCSLTTGLEAASIHSMIEKVNWPL